MTTAPTAGPATRTWPTLVALGVLWVASLVSQVWVFGLLFLAWAAYDIVKGESFFIQRITRRDHPLTFWAIEVSWIAFGLFWILAPS